MSEPNVAAEPAAEPVGEPAAQPVIDWEAEARKWEKRSKDNYAKLKEAEPKLTEYEQIVAARKTESERQSEELVRWQTEAEKWRGDAVKARVETLATDFIDVDDAFKDLGDLSQFLDAGGHINVEAIKAELAAVLDRKPHWRRPDGGAAPVTRTPAPNRAQGSSGGGPAATPQQEFGALIQGALNRS